jgi:hypothetical protein
MNHGVMIGMLWAGVLLSAIPVALGVGIGIYALRQYRKGRAPRTDACGDG